MSMLVKMVREEYAARWGLALKPEVSWWTYEVRASVAFVAVLLRAGRCGSGWLCGFAIARLLCLTWGCGV